MIRRGKKIRLWRHWAGVVEVGRIPALYEEALCLECLPAPVAPKLGGIAAIRASALVGGPANRGPFRSCMRRTYSVAARGDVVSPRVRIGWEMSALSWHMDTKKWLLKAKDGQTLFDRSAEDASPLAASGMGASEGGSLTLNLGFSAVAQETEQPEGSGSSEEASTHSPAVPLEPLLRKALENLESEDSAIRRPARSFRQ